MKLLQAKEPLNLTLGESVNRIMDLLIGNQHRIKKILQLNENSSEAFFLLGKTFGEMCLDSEFVGEQEKWKMELNGLGTAKEIKTQLFSEGTSVIFLNVLEDVGKISRVSKNIPAVLGYSSSELLGISINEILPEGLRKYHDSMLNRFVETYSGGTKREVGIRFYAIAKGLHLVEVEVHFHWVLTDFEAFHLAGVVERVDSDTEVILTDDQGCLQGWTKRIGEELCI